MHGTGVQSLVQEDPMYHGATKPVHLHYWACNPVESNQELQLLKPLGLEPMLHNKRSHLNGKPAHCNEDPVQPKNNNDTQPRKLLGGLQLPALPPTGT